MNESRLRRIARPLIRVGRAGTGRWDAARVRLKATRLLGGAWHIGPIHRARSGTRIARIRSSDGRNGLLKMTNSPVGAARLEHERLTLARLAATPGLANLRSKIPTVMAAGSASGWSFLIQSVLPGEPATRRGMSDQGPIIREASAIASRLHTAASAQRAIAASELDDWIGRPVATIRDLVDSSAHLPHDDSIDRLARELADGLHGATVTLGLVHGDLWADNVLVDPERGFITGLVDWDSAAEAGLAAHDQLHLVLYSRKVQRRSEIGIEICRALSHDPGWDADELVAVSAGTDGLPGEGAASRQRLGIILYWLRLVSMNLARQPAMTRQRRWVDDNVRAVLACL